MQIEGLKNEVTGYYDAHLIPHVFAQNDIDLYSGQLSEIISDKTMEYGRQERRSGKEYVSDNALQKNQDDPQTLVLYK